MQTKPLTVDQLDEFLWRSMDVLRGDMPVSEFAQVIGPLLLLKRASDQPGLFHVPDGARWRHMVERSRTDGPGSALNASLTTLERSNPEQMAGLFNAVNFNSTPSRRVLASLIDYIGRLPLSDEDLEFSDGLGRSFDRFLARTASATGARGSDFFTPRSMCRLMAALVAPEEGHSVADPLAGSGGMLLQAAQYIAEHGGDESNLALFGQEKNSTAWLTGRINLLLHGITNAAVDNSDALTEPLVGDRYELALFDRVLTAPPFSMNYVRHEVRHPERMKYGWTPDKKADLMFVQHALSVLRPDGRAAVVTPHGVLFRGGAEGEIRRRLVEDDRLEAVIGIGGNVFYNTNIPACVLVLSGPQHRPAGRRGQVLFINAEREVTAGRAQNRLDAQHIAKIVDVFVRRSSVPNFSRVVPLDEIRANDFNLNIRRYVDAGPPAEPLLDISAALSGGVPWDEIESCAERFNAFSIDLDHLFLPDRPGYRRFPAEGYEVTAARIPGLATSQERRFLDALQRWWADQRETIAELSGTGRLFASGLRSRLEVSLCEELLPMGILDRYQLLGALASWWSDHEDDLRALSVYGFAGVVRRLRSPSRDRAAQSHQLPSLPSEEQAAHVLDMLANDLSQRIEQLVTGELRKLIDAYLQWGERYATSMADLEDQYWAAANRLRSRMTSLGYI
jgi:type I restriction enzyme M protein